MAGQPGGCILVILLTREWHSPSNHLLPVGESPVFDPFIRSVRRFYTAPIIITTATRGHRQRKNINMGRNELLVQTTYRAVFVEGNGLVLLEL